MSGTWPLQEVEAQDGVGGEKKMDDSLSVIINQLRNLGQSAAEAPELFIENAIPPSPYSTLPRQWSQQHPTPPVQARCKRSLTFAPDNYYLHQQPEPQHQRRPEEEEEVAEEEQEASCCAKAAELGFPTPCHYCATDTASSSPDRCDDDYDAAGGLGAGVVVGGGGGLPGDVSYDGSWPASAYGSYAAPRARVRDQGRPGTDAERGNHHHHQRRRQRHEEEEDAGRSRRHRDAGGGGRGDHGCGGGGADLHRWHQRGAPRGWRLLEPFSTSSLEGDDSFELILREADGAETAKTPLKKKDAADAAAKQPGAGAGQRKPGSGRRLCCCGGDGTGDGGRRCRRSLGSCLLALLLAPCLVYAAFAVLPWRAVVAGRPGAGQPTPADRLAYAMRCGALALLPLVLGVLAVGVSLLLRQVRGGGMAGAVRAQRAFVSDTAQQLLLHQLAAMALALNLEPQFLPLVLVMAALFVIARLAFWATIRSCYAGFGFCLSFAPGLAMLCHALYCLFTVGPAGAEGPADGAQYPPTLVPPQVQWWGS